MDAVASVFHFEEFLSLCCLQWPIFDTVKPGNKENFWDNKKNMVFIDRWSSLSGHSTWDMKGLSWPCVVFVDRWSLFQGHSTCDMKGLSWPCVVYLGQRSLFPGFTVFFFTETDSQIGYAGEVDMPPNPSFAVTWLDLKSCWSMMRLGTRQRFVVETKILLVWGTLQI